MCLVYLQELSSPYDFKYVVSNAIFICLSCLTPDSRLSQQWHHNCTITFPRGCLKFSLDTFSYNSSLHIYVMSLTVNGTGFYWHFNILKYFKLALVLLLGWIGKTIYIVKYNVYLVLRKQPCWIRTIVHLVPTSCFTLWPTSCPWKLTSRTQRPELSLRRSVIQRVTGHGYKGSI